MMMDCAPVGLQFRLNCSDGDIGQGSDGTQKSKVWVHSQCSSLGKMVRPPGIEPGSQAWKACILTPRQRSQSLNLRCQWMRFKSIDEENSSDRLVEGCCPSNSTLPHIICLQVSGRLGSCWCSSFTTPKKFRIGQWKASILIGTNSYLFFSHTQLPD